MGIWSGLKEDYEKKKEYNRRYRNEVGQVEQEERIKQGKILVESKMKIKREALESQYKRKMNSSGGTVGVGRLAFNPQTASSGLSNAMFGTPLIKQVTPIAKPKVRPRAKARTRVVYRYKPRRR